MVQTSPDNKRERYREFSKFLVWGIVGVSTIILVMLVLIATGVFNPANNNEGGEQANSNTNEIISPGTNPSTGLTGFFANFLTGRVVGARKDIYYNEGFVGVGTSSPSQKLDVRGNIYTNGSILIGIDSTLKLDVNGPARFTGSPKNIEGALIWDDEGKYYKYYNGTEWLSLSGGNITINNLGGESVWEKTGENIYYNNGNVGIGTNSPESKLHVIGDIMGNNGLWAFGPRQTSPAIPSVVMELSTNNKASIQTFGNPIPSLTLQEFGGNVGIGTGSPTAKLDIASNSIRLRESFTPVNNLCTKGTIAYDSNYIYVCVSDNNWKRTSLSSFIVGQPN